MYGWLWRHLPGHWLPAAAHPVTDRWPARALQMLALAVGAVALLMYVVFPWADPKLPFNENTIDAPSSTVPSSTAPSTASSAAPSASGGAQPGTTPTSVPTARTTVATGGPTASASGGVLPGD